MALSFEKRIPVKEVQDRAAGSSVIVSGWAYDVKSLGKIAFITLRDRTGLVQLTALPDFSKFAAISKIPKESVIIAKGKVQKSKQKAGGKELLLEDFEIVSTAAPLPIDMTGKIATGLDKRLDYRIIDLRNPQTLAIFKIRSRLSTATREFLVNERFIEMHTPKIIGAGAEGGATLFKVDYYGKKAYLSQSQQLYKQMLLAAGFERVFEIGPTFRAEKSHTTRHLAEFTHLDFEMSFIDDEDAVLKVLERWFVFVLKDVQKNCKKELALLGVKIEIPKLPFPRVTYGESVEMLGRSGAKIRFGDDIGTEEEKKLGELIRKKYRADAYFITKWPANLKPFYIMYEGNLSRGFDFGYRGLELASGGQREHRVDILAAQIQKQGMNPGDFEFYLSAFRYGMPTHGGFGLGFDRLVQLVCGLENIREAVLFPRDPERLMP